MSNPTPTQLQRTTIMLTWEDRAAVGRIIERYGLRHTTDAIRLALRALAESDRVSIEVERPMTLQGIKRGRKPQPRREASPGSAPEV